MSRIFISYSHDSEEHKNWVKKLAELLRGRGLEVLLDDDLKYGDDIVQFMNDAINSSDTILLVCTRSYKTKADEYRYSGDTGLGEAVLNALTWFLENGIQPTTNIEEAFSRVIKKGSYDKDSVMKVYGELRANGVKPQDTFGTAFKKLIKGGVQYENLVIAALSRCEPSKRKIPILREGDGITSVPKDLGTYLWLDLRPGQDPENRNLDELCKQLRTEEDPQDAQDIQYELPSSYDRGRIDELTDLPGLKRFTQFVEKGQKNGRWYVVRTDPIRGDRAIIYFNGLDSRLAEQVWRNWYGDATRARDVCGAMIEKIAFGRRDSDYGWELDHIIPRSRGGGNGLNNLRPLHRMNNFAKGDRLDGYWSCARSS